MRTLGFALVVLGVVGTVLTSSAFGGSVPFPPVLLSTVGIALIVAKELEELR